MSDWDALFALASGTESTSSNKTHNHDRRENSHEEFDTSNRCRKKRKKREAKFSITKGVRNRCNNVPGYGSPPTENGARFALLNSRMDPIEKQICWPPWLCLGPPLIDTFSSCKRWEESISKRDETSSEKRDRHCKNCKLNPLYHSLEIDTKFMDHNAMNAYLTGFTLIRDIRCCCSCIISHEFVSSTLMNRKMKPSLRSYAKIVMNKATKLVELLSSAPKLPDGEAEILREKFHQVFSVTQSWSDKVNQCHDAWRGLRASQSDVEWDIGNEIFDEMINLIVQCDRAYYRLYYLQITGLISIFNKNGIIVCIPHPPTYFGVDYLSWDVIEGEYKRSLLLDDINNKFKVDNKSDDSSPDQFNHVLCHFGLLENYNKKSLRHHDSDPLCFLHQNRLMETILIFWGSGWVKSNAALSQMASALQKYSKRERKGFYEKHETPAPIVLMQWRDSCRDFICNLYAYATLDYKTINNAISSLQQHGVTHGILELGAGTGYVAKLFQKCGISIKALDIAPTKSDGEITSYTLNEYHGDTPAYLLVTKGNVNTLSSNLNKRDKARKTALLLCYPPPHSTMAYDAAHAFVSSGGYCIIHIGEFKGLTGTFHFETYLRREFQLCSRKPCLQWGTDSAEITIWIQRYKTNIETNTQLSFNEGPLIPCSNCRNVEAIKRCRLSRSLVYCSLECFQLHYASMMAHLSLSMVSAELGKQLDFNNPNHFISL